MQMRWLAVPVLMAAFGGAAVAASCPPLLEGQLPKLRAKESIDLCQRFAGKPLVIVNTASFCGFAPQFKGLEALYQRYKGQGLEVIGVPSDDFKQEAKTGEETAKVCYVNYGVTFTMTEPQTVKGPDAVHLFKIQVRGGSPGQSDRQFLQPDQTGQPGLAQGGRGSVGVQTLIVTH